MKIFKTSSYAVKQKFLVACEQYKIYLHKRGAGQNVKPRPVDEQIKQYVAAVLKAERLEEKPPEIEWINLSREEHRKREEEDKRREEQEKNERERAEKESELRKQNLKKAAEAPEYKKFFIRQELDENGITIERQVEEMVSASYDGKRNQDFWNERRRILDELDNEIKEAGESDNQ